MPKMMRSKMGTQCNYEAVNHIVCKDERSWGGRRCRVGSIKTGDDNKYNKGEEDKDDNGGEVLGGEGGGWECKKKSDLPSLPPLGQGRKGGLHDRNTGEG